MSAALILVDDIIGKPWRRGARGPDAFDCWGLILELARRSRVTVPADWDSCDMTRAEQREIMAVESALRTYQVAEPVDGAIAYCGWAGHAGWCLHGRIIHAARGAGVVAVPVAVWMATYPGGTWHAWQS